MPYSINDTRAYVKQLQRMLGVPVTGKVGKQMRDKIKTIQRENGSTADGRVDYRTFLLIRAAKKCTPHINAVRGEASYRVERLNLCLSQLVRFYRLPCRQPRGSYFGRDTARAVSHLRRLYLLPEGDEIDVRLEGMILLDTLSIIATDS